MKIKITADSTCDLSKQLAEQYDIGIFPLHVSLGEDDYLDGESVTPDQLLAYYTATKKLPKTGARSVEDFQNFFQGILAQGYDAIIHYSLSSSMSSSHNNAVTASKDMPNVYVVDTKNLSTGSGLLIIDACDARDHGYTAQQICERSQSRLDSVQASFIIDTLEFLHKGGRCSSLSYLGANLLQIKPIIEVKNGKMGVARKPIGRYSRCLDRYVAEIKNSYVNPDTTRCFVTHTKMDADVVQHVVDEVKSWGVFREVIETEAGSTITTHCGANTLGVLFINDGGKEF